MVAEPAEAAIDDGGNLLIAPRELHGHEAVEGFFGGVGTPEELASGALDPAGRTVYLYGCAAAVDDRPLGAAARVFAIREPADGGVEGPAGPWPVVGLGRVPLRVHGAGVYYRRFFQPDGEHFRRICAEHEFQSLTESTKPGTAHRRGIYLTPVTREDGGGLRFHLLRCSTNLSGPTDNFRETDTRIAEELNREAGTVFRGHAPLNHVLAQVYRNTRAAAGGGRQSKARISAHADKTKDMPVNGIMAFCTFYDGLDALQPLDDDPFDLGVKRASGLTRLRFLLKEPARGAGAEGERAALPEQFTLTLYPGSVFFMPLSTNRLYTHEIRASMLDAEVLPTRLGYVMRCSKTAAVHRGGRTFLDLAGGPAELEQPSAEGMEELRRLYAAENRTTSFVDYGGRFRFSMNEGDYRAPRI